MVDLFAIRDAATATIAVLNRAVTTLIRGRVAS
jgi:hypothetical protein